LAGIELSKAFIAAKARELGAELVGFAPVERWGEFADIPENYYPQRVWPLARTVIVLGAPQWLPIVEAAPSELGREQYLLTNTLLDLAAYRLAAYLNRNNGAAINLCRDGYGEAGTLNQEMAALFSHVWAGYYAGLGRVGWNHTLLTPEYGPRLRLVSVLTELELEGDSMMAEEICTKCLLCRKICPSGALSGDRRSMLAKMDKQLCLQHSHRLRQAFRNPCGFCTKVCPVGRDRQLFKSTNVKKYFPEQQSGQERAVEANPEWRHIRRHGGYPLEEENLEAEEQPPKVPGDHS
jgi:epoxyqueuosine reductase